MTSFDESHCPTGLADLPYLDLSYSIFRLGANFSVSLWRKRRPKVMKPIVHQFFRRDNAQRKLLDSVATGVERQLI
jgi:hypothetical protein